MGCGQWLSAVVTQLARVHLWKRRLNFNIADLLFELDEQHVLVGGGVPDDPQTVDV